MIEMCLAIFSGRLILLTALLHPAHLSRHWAAASVVVGTMQSMSSHADCAEKEADEEADEEDAEAAEGTSAIRRSPEAEAAEAAVAFALPLPLLFASSPSAYLSAPRRT